MVKTGRCKQCSRVVARSYNNANTNGGVAYVNANNGSSNSNDNIGSRLAINNEYNAENSVEAEYRLRNIVGTTTATCSQGSPQLAAPRYTLL